LHRRNVDYTNLFLLFLTAPPPPLFIFVTSHNIQITFPLHVWINRNYVAAFVQSNTFSPMSKIG
jgi:hypothetical protein